MFCCAKKIIWYFFGAIVHGSARRKTRFPFVCAFALRNRGAYLIDAPSRESCSTRGLPLASTGSAEHSGPTRLPARKRRAAGWHSPKKGRLMIGGSKQKYDWRGTGVSHIFPPSLMRVRNSSKRIGRGMRWGSNQRCATPTHYCWWVTPIKWRGGVKKIECLGEKGQKKKAFLENTQRFFEATRAARSPRCK